jgi:hypothetical protein
VAEHLAKTDGAPPIRVWLYAGLIVVSLFLLTWSQLPDDWQSHNSNVNTDSYCAARWNNQTPWSAQQPYRVLALGTSLFHSASGTRADFIQRLGPTIAWENCWVNGGQWPHFSRVRPAALRLKPALLLLQSDVLTTLPWHQQVFSAFTSAVKDKVRGQQKPPPDIYAQPPFICSNAMPQPIQNYEQLYSANPQIFAQALRWMLELKASGTQVVIVDIPRAKEIEEKMDSFLPQWRQAVRQLAKESGAHYWMLPAPTTTANIYCPDQAHLDISGRQQTAAELSAFVLKTRTAQ